MRSITGFIFCLMFALSTSAFGQTMRIPLMNKPPVMDGNVQPSEWANASGFDGFLWNGELERRRARCYIGATETTLYLAILTQLPAEGNLTANVKNDTLKVVYDDSLEVWLDPTPGTERGKTFQMLANSIEKTAWGMHPRGGEAEDAAWQGKWQVSNGMHDGWWHCEIRIPVQDIAPGRKVTDSAWGINLCRNWKEPWAFSSLGGAGYAPTNSIVFTTDAVPAIQQLFAEDPITGRVRSTLRITNPGTQQLTVSAEQILKRDLMPEINEKQSITLASGETKELKLSADSGASKQYHLQYSVTDGNAPVVTRTIIWKAAPAWQWKVTHVAPPPVDFQFSYYPYLNRMRIIADVSGLPKTARVQSATLLVRKAGVKGGASVKEIRLTTFKNSRSITDFTLPELNGKYEIALKLQGQGVPAGERVKLFERTRYPWEHNKMGRSAKVYPPFTPLVVKGATVSSVLRKHEVNGDGLWKQVVAAGKPLLAGPMHYTITSNGQTASPTHRTLAVQSSAADRVVETGGFTQGKLIAVSKMTWDYDGMMRMDLTLSASAPQKVDALTLEIPLLPEIAQMLHAMGDGIRNTLYEKIPAGQGVVWKSDKVQANDLPKGFCTYIYAGNANRGLCWFAENDRNFSWTPGTPNVEIVRDDKQVTLRIHLINTPVTIDRPRTLTFGLQAAPIKPRLEPWRYIWMRDNYNVLGTDINWLALGDCGSVYPAGKDMRLWEMIKRGSKERLSQKDVDDTYALGKKYFEPYGQEMLNTFKAHVGHNLMSHYGAKMVFYYNRSSYQAADEFQTFQDEWCQSDYRQIGPGTSRGEIAIVPSESYIDHALWWYAKSFEIGGNQGVYWDNWFFNPSYNTVMTNAYTRNNGDIMPSTGIWGLRELARRTFQMMNERGMRPFTMPHMTSTGILPMLAFATTQYDWEWKYSEGDVQGRFPREYIQLVSNGNLAGVMPVLLGDSGALQSDPWTQRTFAGVSLVHEMMPSGWLGSVWDPLTKPLFTLLDRAEKARTLKVYRYWDDKPQPISTGNPNIPCIIYSEPGKEALCILTGYSDNDEDVTLRIIDPRALGLPVSPLAMDVESGQSLPVNNGVISIRLKRHDVLEIRLSM